MRRPLLSPASALVLLSFVACAQLCAQAVRVLGPDGKPVPDARVLFVCENGRLALKEAMAWMVTQKRDLLPVEMLPGDGVAVVAYTDESGLATTLDCRDLRWSASVIHGDLGVEVSLDEPGECGMVPPRPTDIGLRPLHHVLVLGCDGRPVSGVEVAADRSERVFETDNNGQAAVPAVVAARSGAESTGFRWIAPGTCSVVPWAEPAGGTTVMTLPPVETLVVVDAEYRSDRRPARLHADCVMRRMLGGTVRFRHVPVSTPVDLSLDGGLDAPWKRTITVEPGHALTITLREPPGPVLVKGTVWVRPAPPGKLTVFAMFVDRQPGEPADEAPIEPDGSFTLHLLSRDAPADRDVAFIVKPEELRLPRESRFAPIRKRLCDPDPAGAFQVGMLSPELIPVWLAGAATDMRGQPLRNADLELNLRAGCGTTGGGGHRWGEDAVEADPTLPQLDEWPRKIRTDAEGRFSVTGSRDMIGCQFYFSSPDRRCIREVPEGLVTPPALDVRLVIEDEDAVWVVIEAPGDARCVVNGDAIVNFEARWEGSPESPPIVIGGTGFLPSETIEDDARRPWVASTQMRLSPGRWFVSMTAYGSDDVLAQGRIEVAPGSDSEEDGQKRHFRLQPVPHAPPEPPEFWKHEASLKAVGADGRLCSYADVWKRVAPPECWERQSVGNDGITTTVEFDEDEIEVLVGAPGFMPLITRVPPGSTTITLQPAPETQVAVQVAPLSPGVQKDATWWVHLVFVRTRPEATPAEIAWPKGYGRGDAWYRVAGGSRIQFTESEPGIWNVELRGGPLWQTLTYATREIEVGSGRSAALTVTVDPNSEGMRARTAGIGW